MTAAVVETYRTADDTVRIIVVDDGVAARYEFVQRPSEPPTLDYGRTFHGAFQHRQVARNAVFDLAWRALRVGRWICRMPCRTTRRIPA